MTMPTNIAPGLGKATGIGIEIVVQPIFVYMITFLVRMRTMPIEALRIGATCAVEQQTDLTVPPESKD